jgi:hypothetical protein
MRTVFVRGRESWIANMRSKRKGRERRGGEKKKRRGREKRSERGEGIIIAIGVVKGCWS